MDKKLDTILKKTSFVMVLDGCIIASTSLMVSILRTSYSLEYDFTGMLPAALSLGNFISGILFGILPAFTGTWAAALILSAGLFLGYFCLTVFSAPAMLIAGFFLIGIGKATTINHCTVIMGNNLPDRSRAVNMINALFAFGSLMSPAVVLAAGVIHYDFAAAACMATFGLIIWIMFYSIRVDGKSGARPAPDDISFLKERHFWLSTLFLFFNQCTEISVTSWLVTYFKDTGVLSGAFGDFTVTVMWTAMLLGRLLIVYVIPQGSRLVSLTAMSVGAFVMYLLLVTSDTGITAIIFLFLFAFFMSGTYPTVIALSSRTLNNASMGVMLPLGGIGAIIMPYVTGFAAQRIGLRGGMMCTLFTIAAMFIISRLLAHTR